MKKYGVPIILLLIISTLLLVTRRDKSKPNLYLFTEMTRSPAAQSQGLNPVFANGKTQQVPVAGTIARDFTPFLYKNNEEDRARAGVELGNPLKASLDVLQRGKHLYQNFCSHCHGRFGKGDGAVAKKIPILSMPIVTKATYDIPDGELFHIISYGKNNMPPHRSQISQVDRWKLLHYLRDMQEIELERLADQGLIYEEEAEDPRVNSLVSVEYGKEVYQANCGSCHGKEGRKPLRGVPTLNHPRVLAVAQEDYYLDIITHGRKGTSMSAWEEILSPTQIQSLARYIRSWATPKASELAKAKGDPKIGKSIYRGNCMACHGNKGKGGIGNALNSPSFLAVASDWFLKDTIKFGRKHTAMPAGFVFSDQDLGDLLSYIKSWKATKAKWRDVKKLLAKGGSARIGKKIWRSRCASCHGKKGEGGIGARINSESFLTKATDKFLYRAIVEGRPGTSMPAWHFLKSEDISDLITFMRKWQRKPSVTLEKRSRGAGRAEFGEYLYNQGCIACHGPEGSGGVGGQIGNKVFLDSASDEFLWDTIAYGKDDTAMRGFLKNKSAGALMPMTASDIDHVVAYLRKLQIYPREEVLRRPRESTSLALGKEVYDSACSSCHGDQGQGSSGPAIGNPDFLKAATDGYLIGTIILGRENTEMLSFYRGGNVSLSQIEVENVVAYLRSFGTDTTHKYREYTRSKATVTEGKELYLNHCGGCHGSDGKGPANNATFDGYAPSLNNPEFLRAADDGFLLATIALGRPGTPMRSFAKGAGGISDLSANEIHKIVAFIRSWEEGK